MKFIVFSFAVCFLMCVLFLKTRLANLALDQPNHRSLHTVSIPRSGGVAIMSGALLSWLMFGVSAVWLGLLLALIATSLIDDFRGLSVKWRFLVQWVVSVIFVWYFLPNLAWTLSLVLSFAIVWMANLYNFMDGSDGLAGGMAVFGFWAYAVVAYMEGDIQLALMGACIVSANMAFLIFNFHPARIFMGDAGSVPLGFLAGSMGLYGWQHGLWPIWFPVLVFSPFIVDATVTLLKRLYKGEKVWQAHRSHYYQRLVQTGWGHRNTALAEYALMLAAAVSGVLFHDQTDAVIFLLLGFWGLLFALIMRLIDQRWAKIG